MINFVGFGVARDKGPRQGVWVVRRTLLLASALAGVLVAPIAHADEIPPPKTMMVDANGVDLLSGDVSVSQLLNSIGPSGPGGLSASKTLRANGADIYSLPAYISINNDEQWEDPVGGPPGEWTRQRTTLVLNGRSLSFEGAAGTQATYTEDEGSGTFNTDATSTSGIIYTLPDGTKAVFGYALHLPTRPAPAIGLLQSITYPTGEILTYGSGIRSSLGYLINSPVYSASGPSDYSTAPAYNLTQPGCDEVSCVGPGFVDQVALGRAVVKTASGATVTFTPPSGNGVRTYTLANVAFGTRVTSVSIGGSTWTYGYTRVQDHPEDPYFIDGVLTTTVTAPNGVQRIVISRVGNGHVLSDREGIVGGAGGRLTTYAYSSAGVPNTFGYGKLSMVNLPGGDAYGYVIDGYDRVLSRTHYPKGYGNGTTPAPTTIRAGYSCRTATGINTTICNQPDWTQDELLHQTDYTYDPVHGGVLTVTSPAPAAGAVRPQVRYTYGQFTAMYVRDGVMQAAAAPVWRLTQTSTCQTQAGEIPATSTTAKVPAACLGTADEIVTAYTYQPSNAPNNVRLLSTTTRAGDNSLSATTSYSYNDRGDITAVDGPLPGSADTTRSYYDASRWTTGQIGPDPDGGGPLLYRAARTTYNADGKVTLAETGTATSQADNAMDSFAPLAFTRNLYAPTTGKLIKVEAGKP